jgi:hypothetical protein
MGIMAVEDTFPQHIAPFGIMLPGRGIHVADYVIGIRKNETFIPTIED